MTGLEAIPKISELLALLVKRVKDRETGSLVQQIQQHQLEIQAALMAASTKIQDLERQLAESQAEDLRIYKGIEFRRGKRTGGKWLGFCPKCHMPAQDAWIPRARRSEKVVMCSARCHWQVFMDFKLDDIAKELEV